MHWSSDQKEKVMRARINVTVIAIALGFIQQTHAGCPEKYYDNKLLDQNIESYYEGLYILNCSYSGSISEDLCKGEVVSSYRGIVDNWCIQDTELSTIERIHGKPVKFLRQKIAISNGVESAGEINCPLELNTLKLKSAKVIDYTLNCSYEGKVSADQCVIGEKISSYTNGVDFWCYKEEQFEDFKIFNGKKIRILKTQQAGVY